MKAWILIAFYQWKDIWHRWFETPGGFLSRILVACLLSVFMLLLQATFELASKTIESRILRLGVNNVLVRSTTSAQEIKSGMASFRELLEPLRAEGDLLAVKGLFAPVRTEYGGSAIPFSYHESVIPDLAAILDGPGEGSIYLLSNEFAEGIPLQVQIEQFFFDAHTRKIPANLAFLASGQDILLVPEGLVAPVLDKGYQEVALFVAADENRIPEYTLAIRALMEADNRRGLSIQSAESWLGELNELKERQRRWQTATAFFCMGLLVLVFGSISILEYRQNAFISALTRSFGVPSSIILCRYLAEALLLVGIAAALSFALVINLHTPVFRLVGFEDFWLNLERLNPYTLRDNWILFAALAMGAFCSVIPIMFAMRRPVGRILA